MSHGEEGVIEGHITGQFINISSIYFICCAVTIKPDQVNNAKI